MELISYSDVVAFSADVLPFLLDREVENNLMISIIIRLADGTARWGDEPARLYLVRDGGRIVAAATQTPPYNLILTEAAPEITAFIADQLKVVPFPGVLGPRADAERFAQLWQQRTGCSAELAMAQGVYQLDCVEPPAGVSGHAEVATLDDFELLVDWNNAFLTEANAAISDVEAYVRGNIVNRHLILWKDPEPVSCTSYGIPTPNGTRVGGVYTPLKYRRRGYAAANVAAVSQRALDEGNRYCCLFTDLSNPTSNSIYRKIGYRWVCEFAQFSFA